MKEYTDKKQAAAARKMAKMEAERYGEIYIDPVEQKYVHSISKLVHLIVFNMRSQMALFSLDDF